MSRTLVLTIIGDDRPGLVGSLAAAISERDGNWLESSLAHLAGKFAGVVRIEVPEEGADGLLAALASMPELRVIAEASDVPPQAAGARRFALSLVGHDRIGIVSELSAVLARHSINVEKLTTRTASAPMSSETLFHADAELQAGAGFDSAVLQSDLERISADLMVDITLVDN
ncbi:MAG: glycine cleavage system protein R [Rhodocyclaceae bacterium]|nr:glycine cleavage system protein R [Rhodocyclaceae bacterium]